MEQPRPTSISAAPFPAVNTSAAPIPVVCRFVPYDQWFLTHLAPHWKGKHIKHHILSKSLNLTYIPPDLPVFAANDLHHKDQRPPSPITFAPDPRARPASPILFADVRVKNPLLSSDDDDDSLMLDDDLSIIKSPSDVEGLSDVPTARDKGKARQVDSGDDDSLDESAVPQGGRVLPSRSNATHSLPSSSTTMIDREADSHLKLRQPSKLFQKLTSSSSNTKIHTTPKPKEDPKAVPQVAHLSFSLMRFSTGQILEDEYPLSDHDIYPHEIIELHFSFSSIRKDSLLGTLPPTPKFPFPLLVPPTQPSRTKSKRRLQELIAAHSIRLVQLPRSIPQVYIQPYWEGWVRILRYVCRDDQDLYTGGFPVPGASGLKNKGVPGAAQYGPGTGPGTSLGQLTSEVREKDIDVNLALNFGLVRPKDHRSRDRVHGSGSYGQDTFMSTKYVDRSSRFEWRERWLVIRDGWIFLLRDRSELKPTHRFPLSHLFMLRDADRLTESIENAKSARSLRPHHSKDHSKDRPLSPPPPPPREKGHASTPSVAHSIRTPSPDSTLKGVPISSKSPLQSGYGHGRHRLGGRAPKGPSYEDEAYDEDDEDDHKKTNARSPKKRGEDAHHRHHHEEHHRHTHSQSRRTEAPRRRDLTDPAVRARINRSTFIPNSKDEAELLGMRIVCAKFLHPTPAEKENIPDPFGGSSVGREATLAMKERYTSTGPTLADVATDLPSGIVGYEERETERSKGKESAGKMRERGPAKSADNVLSMKQKARLHSKGSAPSSLSTDFGPGNLIPKSFTMTPDRRPSLPVIPRVEGADQYVGGHDPLASAPLLNPGANASTTTLSFSSLFGSAKDKEEKKREKEMKKAAKREKKERDMDNLDGATSATSWKLGIGKRSRDKGGSTTPLSTAGTVDEEIMILSKPKESLAFAAPWNPAVDNEVSADMGASFRSSVSSGMDGDPFPTFAKPPGLSSDEDYNDSGPETNRSIFSNFSNINYANTSINQGAASISPSTKAEAKVAEASDSDSDSISLSSPVFARDDTSGAGESDLDMDLGIQRRRTGYRYGGYKKPEGPGHKSLVQDLSEQEMRQGGITITQKWTATEEVASPATATNNKRPGASHESKSKPDRRRTVRRGEWVIMDFGNDAAYHSLLRILHRHTNEPISSSFMPGLRSLTGLSRPSQREQDSPPPPSPPPKDTPFNKPLPPSPDKLHIVGSTGNSPVSLRGRSQSDAAFMTQTRLSRTGPYSDDENDHDGRSSRASPTPLTPRYRSQFSSLGTGNGGRAAGNALPRGLGAYPYPEWRLQAVHRAMRAGLGQVNRPLELMLLAMNERHAEYFNHVDPVFFIPASPAVTDIDQSEAGTSAGLGEAQEDDNWEEGGNDGDNEEEEEEEEEEKDVELMFTSESEDEDLSEYEWQAWSADLPRQLRIRHERRSIDSVPSSTHETVGAGADLDDTDKGPPTSLEGELALILKKRRKREPCGVITSLYTSTALPGFVATDMDHHDNDEHRQYHRVQRYPAASLSVATSISSLSSSESLVPVHHRQVNDNAGHSVSSSMTSSPHSTHTRGHSHSISHTLPHKASRSSNRHSLLNHSASMQSSLRIPQESIISHESSSMKKTSMPIIGATTTTTVTEQTFSLQQNSFGMAIQELKGQDSVSGSPSVFPMHISTSHESYQQNPTDFNYDIFDRPGSPAFQRRAPSNISLTPASPLPSASPSNLRHQSSNYSMGPSSTTSPSSTSASSPVRPNVLKKKPSDRDLEPRGRKTSLMGSGSISRPKLTVATASAPTQVESPLQSPVRPFVGGTPSNRNASRSKIRHNKSGSSLRSALGLADAEPPTSPVASGSGEPKAARKKKSGAFGKFVKSFDSAFP